MTLFAFFVTVSEKSIFMYNLPIFISLSIGFVDFNRYLMNIQEYQETSNSRTTKDKNHIYGGFAINYLMYTMIPLLIFSPLFSYYMATKYHQASPYPHTTITNMSRFYPQDIVMRFLMLPNGLFLNLVYLTAFGWLKLLKRQTCYPESMHQWLLPIGQMSILGFEVTIATIDGGKLPLIHIIGALFFFLVLLIVTTLMTLTMRDMYDWCPSIMSGRNILVKQIIEIYLILVDLYCVIGVFLEFDPTSNDDPKYLVIFEWNLILGCLLWLLTFSQNWGNVYITLKEERTQT